jgi:hypothetical protein
MLRDPYAHRAAIHMALETEKQSHLLEDMILVQLNKLPAKSVDLERIKKTDIYRHAIKESGKGYYMEDFIN